MGWLLPVVGVGGLHTPDLIKKALDDNRMDIVAICRGLIADPHLVKKIKENRAAEQQLCIRCDLCLERTWAGLGLMCSVNSMMGKEASRDLRLVGQVLAASVIKDLDSFKALVNSYEARLKSLDVSIKLNHKITAEEINQLQPDSVIIATGAEEKIADIPGASQSHVTTGTAVLSGKIDVTGEVAVIGATMIGCQVALHLARNGCRVKLIGKTPESDFGSGLMMDNVQIALIDRMAENGVKLYPETELTEIKENAIVVKISEGGQEVFETDTVVFTEEFVPVITITPDMMNENINTFQVGDCTKPKNIFSAIQQGANAAFELSKD